MKYKSDLSGKVLTRYLTSEFVGHCTAVDLVNLFEKTMKKFELREEFLLQVGMDGPAVNKSFLKTISSNIQKNCKKELLNIGTCLLHPTHSAFEKFVEGFSMNVDDFVINIHSFFKFSACRMADYKFSTLETEIEALPMLRHISRRWLSFKKVVERI